MTSPEVITEIQNPLRATCTCQLIDRTALHFKQFERYESLEGSNIENKKIIKSRNYEIKSHYYEIKSRNYEIKSRYYEI